jgi:hypothetical protein
MTFTFSGVGFLLLGLSAAGIWLCGFLVGMSAVREIREMDKPQRNYGFFGERRK